MGTHKNGFFISYTYTFFTLQQKYVYGKCLFQHTCVVTRYSSYTNLTYQILRIKYIIICEVLYINVYQNSF